MNLVELLESVKPKLPERHTLNSDGRITPLISLEKPFCDIVPGQNSEFLYKFHEVFPDIFNAKTGFMGTQPFRSSDLDAYFWNLPHKLVFSQDGNFDSNNNFHAPILAYKSAKSMYGDVIYTLFQQGSYQMLPSEEQDGYLEKGHLKVFRGIGKSSRFILYSIDDLVPREDYLKYLACSFLSSTLSYSFNGMPCRAETEHVNDSAIRHFLWDTGLNKIRLGICVLEQSFSTRKCNSANKFGPNYISAVTPLDNIRLLSQYCGEDEIYVLDPRRLTQVEMHTS